MHHGTPRVQEPAGSPPPTEPTWQGVPLALDQLAAYLHQIKGALQPPRPDVIDKAAQSGLLVVDLLSQYWGAQPPAPTGKKP